MKKNTTYIIVVLVAISIVALVYFGLTRTKPVTIEVSYLPPNSTTTKSTIPGIKPTPTTAVKGPALTSGNVSNFYSYANTPYNFSIQYPPSAKPLTSFATFHEIGNNWRLYPGQANQGKSVVSFSLKNIDQGIYSTGKQTYPLYFTAEVRIGVSPNIKECYTPDVAYPNQKITNVTINGVPFKKFSTSDAGMMKYTQAESYRTIRNNQCYVIEQIKSGTTYRDEKMSVGTTDAQLDAYYALGERIVKTFKFTK